MSETYPLVGEIRGAAGRIDRILNSAADTITARAGGGQALATQLTRTVNHVSVVATAADSVRLPQALKGASCVVINAHPTNAIQVFGFATDTINDVATATGVSQAAARTATYHCPVDGKWYRVLSA